MLEHLSVAGSDTFCVPQALVTDEGRGLEMSSTHGHPLTVCFMKLPLEKDIRSWPWSTSSPAQGH